MEDTSPGTHVFYLSDSRGSVMEIRLTDTTTGFRYLWFRVSMLIHNGKTLYKCFKVFKGFHLINVNSCMNSS